MLVEGWDAAAEYLHLLHPAVAAHHEPHLNLSGHTFRGDDLRLHPFAKGVDGVVARFSLEGHRSVYPFGKRLVVVGTVGLAEQPTVLHLLGRLIVYGEAAEHRDGISRNYVHLPETARRIRRVLDAIDVQGAGAVLQVKAPPRTAPRLRHHSAHHITRGVPGGELQEFLYGKMLRLGQCHGTEQRKE